MSLEPQSAGRPASSAETVSAVVVSYSDAEASYRAVTSLLRQSYPPIEVLVVDNHPEGLFEALVAETPDPAVRIVHSGSNLGYTTACNLAATQARGDWCLFLNPDATAECGCLAQLLGAVDDRTAVVGAQILLPNGRVNAGDNPLHVSGISWAGHYGEPPESGPVRLAATVSGAALLARTAVYRDLDGLCARFFLYQDDADFCWRVRLAGWEVRFAPTAVVVHDYEFDKGAEKWFWLERNRLWSVLANYSWLALFLLSPVLIATEFAVAALAVRDGWPQELLRAWVAILRGGRAVRRWRRRVQSHRSRSDSELMKLMVSTFDTPLLDSPAARRAAPFLRGYEAWVRLVRLSGR